MSLDLTIKDSVELKNLGLTFEKWQVQSPVTSTQSSKNKKIILKKIERDSDGNIIDGFDEQRLSWQASTGKNFAGNLLLRRQ